jgi:hypothetical protein
LQTDSLGRDETNALVAWERQYDSERHIRLAQVETVRLQVLPASPDVIETGIVDRPVGPGPTAQLPDTTDRIQVAKAPVPAVEISLATFDPAPIETGRGQVETSEDFGPDSIIFEQPEETLPADDTDLEAAIFEGDEAGVDILLADLEEGFRLVEAEYAGELLVGMLLDAEDGPDSPEPVILQGHEEEFNLYLGSLEPTQAEGAKELVEALTTAIKDSRELPESTGEEKEIIGQELEKLCVELFEYLGIEYDEEITRRFIQSITAPEPIINIDTYELTAEDLNNMGTREYKPLGDASLLAGLTRFIKQGTQPRRMLGRYTLQVCSA